MLSNHCWREYSLRVDPIKKQLPSRNNVYLALDGRTSTHKLAITSDSDSYMDHNSVLRDVQPAYDVVDSVSFPYFEA